MNSTLTSVLKASLLSVGPHPSHNLSNDNDDALIKLMSQEKANVVIIIFFAIWLVKFFTKTILRARKSMKRNRHLESQPISPMILESGERKLYTL